MVVRGDAAHSDPRVRYEIWVSCDDCGDVVVAGEACVLFRRGSEVTLAYPCTECGRRSVSPVPDMQLERLVQRGFPIIDWRPPLELLEARPVAPVLTWDDLLDAHEALKRTSFVAELLD